ncbi:MAG: pre-peptidase C-terminal domain-containing protein, partial [Trichodesmium sp. MAG_R03]|nr:pre-peptidase C-terminal domain-containing protein [Trichodesmium sp. MAG_R03]
MIGGEGKDNLSGGKGNDNLIGNAGNDILIGGGNADILQGGKGDDTYQLNGKNAGGSKIIDTGGKDTLKLDRAKLSRGGLTKGKVGFERDGTDLIIDLNKNGNFDSQKDLIIEDFLTGKTQKKGKGFIEVVDNLKGSQILDLLNPGTPAKREEDGNKKNAQNLGQLQKKPQRISDEIGYQIGDIRDKRDYYKFTLKGQKKEKFNDLNIVLDGLKDNANIQLLDEDGETIIDQSREKGRGKEEINQILKNGTYYLKVEPQGNAKTTYGLSLSSSRVKDEDGEKKDAQNLGRLKKTPQPINDDIGFQLGNIRDQKDFFKFSVNRDSEVTITLDALKEDANLEVLNKQGSLLFSSSNENDEPEVINTILGPGNYFVKVTPESGDRTKYRLSLSANHEIEDKDGQIPGTDLGKLKAKTISKTDDIGSTTGFTDSDDYWKFKLAKETDLSINLDNLKANADLELYDGDGTTKIFSSKNKGRKEEEIEAILDKGTYYIRVKSVGGSSTKYELNLSGNTEIVDTDGQLPGTPLGELGAEEVTKQDKIGYGGKLRDFQDYYSFSLREKSDVNITLDNLNANAQLELLEVDGGTIETSNKKGRASETIDRILPSGDYYVKVSPIGKAKTKYDLGLTANPATDDYSNHKGAKEIGILYEENTYEETNEIGYKRGSVRDSSDYFHFELTQSQQINISLDDLTQNAGLQLLGGKNGKKQIEISNEDGREPEIINDDLEAGSYYVKVFPVGKAKTKYELSFEALSPDKEPYVVEPGIKDVLVKEDKNIPAFNISKFFKDPDSKIEKIEVTNNSNPGLVIAPEKNENLKGKKLKLKLVKDKHGYGDITITATSKDKTASNTFAVEVDPVDDPPELKLPIEDVGVKEDDPNWVIDLSDHFDDIDSKLTYKIINNSNPSLLSVSDPIKGNNLTLDFLDDQNGDAKITVEATGDGKSVTDTFAVYVAPVDVPPFIDQPIEDFTVEEDAPNRVIELSPVFKDIDSPITLAFTDDGNDNPELVTPTFDIESKTLELKFLKDEHGLANMTLTATSEGKTVEDSFTVTVTPINDPPRLIKKIEDVVVDENAPVTTIDLSKHFEDVDSVITYSIVANNNSERFSATTEGNLLILDYLENQFGIGDITVRAESNGLFAEDTLNVKVNPIDDPPVVANGIADVVVDEDAPATTIDLSNLFTDIDNDNTVIVKAVNANSNSGLVTPVIEGNDLTLNYTGNASGVRDITIEGTSNGKKVSDVLNVKVNPVDDP